MRKGASRRRCSPASLGLALALGATARHGGHDKPQYGGTLEVGTVYVTLSALSWDPRRLELEAQPRHRPVLRAAVRRRPVEERCANGGKHPFYADAWLPTDAIRGELAESWEWKENPLRVEIKLRKGIMFPEKPGVMTSRELVADDVVFSYNRLDQQPEEDHRPTSTTSTRSRRPTSTRSSSPSRTTSPSGTTASAGATTPASCPRKSSTPAPATGRTPTAPGPFMLTDFVPGNSNTYTKNPIYWDKEKIGGAEYKLPFVDKVVYRTIKDEATRITALRTGKLDILEAIRWQNVDELKKNAPQLKWSTLAQHVGHVPGHAGRHQAVRRHPRAPRAQHGGQQAGDRQAPTTTATPSCSPIRMHPDYIGLLRAAGDDAGSRSRSCSTTIPTRPRSCWPKPAIRTASPSRCRCAPAAPTTWTCCRWSPPISRRSASRSRSSPWSTAPSCRR